MSPKIKRCHLSPFLTAKMLNYLTVCCRSLSSNVKIALGFVNICSVNYESVLLMKAIVFVKCAKSQNVGDTVQCREQRKHFDNKKQSIYNKAHDH